MRSVGLSMTDLRDRIAAVLADHHALAGCSCQGVDPMHGQTLHLADAVIAELGLHRNDEEDEYGGYKPTGRHRYVTDWMADE